MTNRIVRAKAISKSAPQQPVTPRPGRTPGPAGKDQQPIRQKWNENSAARRALAARGQIAEGGHPPAFTRPPVGRWRYDPHTVWYTAPNSSSRPPLSLPPSRCWRNLFVLRNGDNKTIPALRLKQGRQGEHISGLPHEYAPSPCRPRPEFTHSAGRAAWGPAGRSSGHSLSKRPSRPIDRGKWPGPRGWSGGGRGAVGPPRAGVGHTAMPIPRPRVSDRTGGASRRRRPVSLALTARTLGWNRYRATRGKHAAPPH